MSKQLTLSASLSVLAMSALALVTAFGGSVGGSDSKPAAAYGTVFSVLLNA